MINSILSPIKKPSGYHPFVRQFISLACLVLNTRCLLCCFRFYFSVASIFLLFVVGKGDIMLVVVSPDFIFLLQVERTCLTDW